MYEFVEGKTSFMGAVVCILVDMCDFEAGLCKCAVKGVRSRVVEAVIVAHAAVIDSVSPVPRITTSK